MKDYPSIKEIAKITHSYGWWHAVGGSVKRIRFRWGRRLELFFDNIEFAVSIPELRDALKSLDQEELIDLTGRYDIHLRRSKNDVVRIDVRDKYRRKSLSTYIEIDDIQWWLRAM